ncbi:substrate-binding domain-containing protein [Pseudomonadota bacterium]
MKRTSQTYRPLDKASAPWKICVSIPHLKDAYWITVNFALVDEAKRLGIQLSVSEAGGYDKLDIQRQQIQKCMASGADGLIVGSISGDGLNDLVAQYTAEGKPVIDLINGINSDKISARAAITFWDSGFLVADYVKKLSLGKPARFCVGVPTAPRRSNRLAPIAPSPLFAVRHQSRNPTRRRRKASPRRLTRSQPHLHTTPSAPPPTSVPSTWSWSCSGRRFLKHTARVARKGRAVRWRWCPRLCRAKVRRRRWSRNRWCF